MTHSKPHRIPWIQSTLVIFAAAAFACAPQPAWAGHGGGGGGGHAGGGGGHVGGGGGGHSSGESHASAPVHVYSAPAVRAPARPPMPATAFQRPAPRPGFYGGSSSGLPAGLAQFAEPQRFGAGGRSPMPSAAAAEPPRSVTIGFPPLGGNSVREAPMRATQGALSFSGEGHDIWQNSVRSQTIIVARPTAPLSTGRRPAGEMARPIIPFRHHHRGFGPGFGFFGVPFFGFGLGFGPGCNAWADPFWGWDWDDCDTFGYSGYLSPGYYPPSDYIEAPDMMDIQPAYGPDAWPPAAPSDSGSYDNSSAAPSTPSTLLYMKDGTSYAITDYWLEGGRLYYITSYGSENIVDLDLVDLQRTVDENAARGVNFTLRPGPEPESPAGTTPTGQPAPNAPPPTRERSAPATPNSPQ